MKKNRQRLANVGTALTLLIALQRRRHFLGSLAPAMESSRPGSGIGVIARDVNASREVGPSDNRSKPRPDRSAQLEVGGCRSVERRGTRTGWPGRLPESNGPGPDCPQVDHIRRVFRKQTISHIWAV
jgi:hypothetical protein